MSLKQYEEKRDFSRTREPKPLLKPANGLLSFVVQKHQASHLHYDFRLELNGVLKSWAVPKGPSLDPKDKRLAMMVEDHPIDYRSFEGIIPPGNYGAGTVMVWDEGVYHLPGISERRACEKAIQQGLNKGHLAFILKGKKLNGEFALVRLKKAGENAWLLIKAADSSASHKDISESDRSVVSGKTLEQIKSQTDSHLKKWSSGNGKSIRSHKKPALRQKSVDLTDAPEAPIPRNVKPMLATLVDQHFDRDDWIFEIKWDGYRTIAEITKSGVKLYSRNRLSFNQKFLPVAEALENFGHEAVLDGEIVVLDETGKSQFQLLQNYQRIGKGNLIYYVFDLLYLDGHDLRKLPLIRRKEILRSVLPDNPIIKFSDHIEKRGTEFFKLAQKQGLEGIMAKNSASAYSAGVRSREWFKIKTHLRQEAIIGGFTEPRGTRKHLGSLVLGVYKGDQLTYIGHSSGRLDQKMLSYVRNKLTPLIQANSPFPHPPKTNAPVHWVKPKLLCEVSFAGWTEDGSMRQPIFMGLREDKPAEEVKAEKPMATEEAVEKMTKNHKMTSKETNTGNAKTEQQLSIKGHRVSLTHLDKVFWPKEKYTKGELIDYYRKMAPFILPYLKDRPESLHRYPNGITGPSFYQKDVDHQPPDWVKTVLIHSEHETKDIRYLVCQDEATLAYLANLACVELNPWSSRINSLDKPDFLIIDLDPEGVSFSKVVESALAVKDVLDRAKAKSICKTSGATGMHICVPLEARYTYAQARQFAELVARLANKRLPALTSVVRSPKERQKKVYLDFLQNSRGQTIVAPYSLRPRPLAPVSTPLLWKEVKAGLEPTQFTIKTIQARVEKLGDLWKPVLGHGIDLKGCLKRLESEA